LPFFDSENFYYYLPATTNNNPTNINRIPINILTKSTKTKPKIIKTQPIVPKGDESVFCGLFLFSFICFLSSCFNCFKLIFSGLEVTFLLEKLFLVSSF